MAEEQEKKSLFSSFKGGGSVSEKDIVVFTRQFSTMIDAGLPLVQGLDILASQVDNKKLARIIGEIKSEVETGSNFADALRHHPATFDDLYANMVAAGEGGGILDTVLQRLADYMEKAMKLKKKVKGAMIYPSVVLSIAALVIGVIMVFVVPTFTKMFSQLGGTLPLPTRIIVTFSDFLSGVGGIIIVGSVVSVVVVIKQIRKTSKGRFLTDQIMLKLPIMGTIVRKGAVAKFTRTLSTLLSSGVPILDSLEMTATTAGNKVVEKTVMEVRGAVTEGRTLADPLSKSPVFPSMVTHMIAIGEATGALDSMLEKIAEFYDDEVDNAVSNLTQALEPIMMVFLGGSVGFIVVAMYLPIFKMIQLVG